MQIGTELQGALKARMKKLMQKGKPTKRGTIIRISGQEREFGGTGGTKVDDRKINKKQEIRKAHTGDGWILDKLERKK